MITNPFDYTNAVSDTENLSMSEKMVALTIARFYNWSEQNPAFPSNETIAKKAGCTPRTVMRAKASLIEKGWLSSKRRFNKSNHYVPCIPTSDTMSHDNMTGDTMSLPKRHDVTSRGDTDDTLTKKLTKNLTKNISSEAAMESEVISQEEELFVPESFVEELALETRGISISSDYLYLLSSDYSFNDVREAIPDNKQQRDLIFDKKKGMMF